MDKTKIYKVINLIIIVGYLLVLIIILFFQFWSYSFGMMLSYSPLLYWLILFGWLGFNYKFKWKSNVSLISAFIFYCIASFITILGLVGIGETVMRLSFIGWLVGVAQALMEYKQRLIKDKNYKTGTY